MTAKVCFLLAAVLAMWGATIKPPWTDYAVWSMYFSGSSLMALMLLRFFRRPRPGANLQVKQIKVKRESVAPE